MPRYTLRFQFDNGSEKIVTLDSDLSLEQINTALYAFFQGRSPIYDVVVNPNRLLAIQIQANQQAQLPQVEEQTTTTSEEDVLD